MASHEEWTTIKEGMPGGHSGQSGVEGGWSALEGAGPWDAVPGDVLLLLCAAKSGELAALYPSTALGLDVRRPADSRLAVVGAARGNQVCIVPSERHVSAIRHSALGTVGADDDDDEWEDVDEWEDEEDDGDAGVEEPEVGREEAEWGAVAQFDALAEGVEESASHAMDAKDIINVGGDSTSSPVMPLTTATAGPPVVRLACLMVAGGLKLHCAVEMLRVCVSTLPRGVPNRSWGVNLCRGSHLVMQRCDVVSVTPAVSVGHGCTLDARTCTLDGSRARNPKPGVKDDHIGVVTVLPTAAAYLELCRFWGIVGHAALQLDLPRRKREALREVRAAAVAAGVEAPALLEALRGGQPSRVVLSKCTFGDEELVPRKCRLGCRLEDGVPCESGFVERRAAERAHAKATKLTQELLGRLRPALPARADMGPNLRACVGRWNLLPPFDPSVTELQWGWYYMERSAVEERVRNPPPIPGVDTPFRAARHGHSHSHSHSHEMVVIPQEVFALEDLSEAGAFEPEGSAMSVDAWWLQRRIRRHMRWRLAGCEQIGGSGGGVAKWNSSLASDGTLLRTPVKLERLAAQALIKRPSWPSETLALPLLNSVRPVSTRWIDALCAGTHVLGGSVDPSGTLDGVRRQMVHFRVYAPCATATSVDLSSSYCYVRHIGLLEAEDVVVAGLRAAPDGPVAAPWEAATFFGSVHGAAMSFMVAMEAEEAVDVGEWERYLANEAELGTMQAFLFGDDSVLSAAKAVGMAVEASGRSLAVEAREDRGWGPCMAWPVRLAAAMMGGLLECESDPNLPLWQPGSHVKEAKMVSYRTSLRQELAAYGGGWGGFESYSDDEDPDDPDDSDVEVVIPP